MRFGRTNPRSSGAERGRRAFTLVEVLAALLFMAIVIPVAVEGLQVASQAGVVAQRKAAAARLGDTVMNDLLVTGQWQRSNARGTVSDGPNDYDWTLSVEPWEYGTLRLMTLDVAFRVQQREFNVYLSTLIDPSADDTNGLFSSAQSTSSSSSSGASSGGTGGTGGRQNP